MRPPRFDDYRGHVARLTQAALAAGDPAAAVQRCLHWDGARLHVDGVAHPVHGRLWGIAVGKAAAPMARAATAVLGGCLTDGLAIVKQFPAEPLPPPWQVWRGEHPVPGAGSLQATAALRAQLAQTAAADLVLCLLSGGASALLTAPRLPFADWQALNRQLLAAGCDIAAFNAVRRALDAAKGGGLAAWAAPAPVVTLILSDVPHDPIRSVGSGPTAARPDDAAAARAVLTETGVWERLAPPTRQAVESALQQAGQTAVSARQHVVIGDVRLAARAAARAAAELGFAAEVELGLSGEAQEVGRQLAARALAMPPGRCLIVGGETTVTLREPYGRGGRNQELALAAALALDGRPGVVLATLATDGEDGPTPAAGALVAGDSVARARALGLDAAAALATHASFDFFAQLGPDQLRPGPTGTNLNDLVFVLTYEEQ